MVDLQQLRSEISAHTGIPREEQRLYIETVELARHGYLSQYVRDDDKMHLDINLVRRPQVQSRWLELFDRGAVPISKLLAGSIRLPGVVKSDRECMLELLAAAKAHPSILLLASLELLSDKQFALNAVKQNKEALQFLSADLQSDPDVVSEVWLSELREVYAEWADHSGCCRRAMTQFMRSRKAPECVGLNAHRVLAAGAYDTRFLGLASEALWATKEFVVPAVKLSPRAFMLAAEELQLDPDVSSVFLLGRLSEIDEYVMAAIDDQEDYDYDFDPAALEKKVEKEVLDLLTKSGEWVKSDEKHMLAAIRCSGKAFAHACSELQANKEFCLRAVGWSRSAFQFAPLQARSDRDVALAAVQNYPAALQYASTELQGDKELVQEAITADTSLYHGNHICPGAAIQFAAEELRADKELVMLAVKHGAPCECLSAQMLGDREVVNAALKYNGGCAMRFASEEIRADKELVLSALSLGGTLDCISCALRADRDVVLFAVEVDGMALQHAPNFQTDKEVVLSAAKQNPQSLRYANLGDDTFARAIVESNWRALEFVDAAIQNDAGAVMAAVKQNGSATRFASAQLRSDKDFMMSACKTSTQVFQYASEELQKDADMLQFRPLRTGKGRVKGKGKGRGVEAEAASNLARETAHNVAS